MISKYDSLDANFNRKYDKKNPPLRDQLSRLFIVAVKAGGFSNVKLY